MGYWHIQKEQDEKCLLDKNEPVSTNQLGDISTVMSDAPYKSF